MRKLKVGDFVKYIRNQADVVGCYGLIFRRLNPRHWISSFQVVWFGDKRNRRRYDISGVIYRKGERDVKFVAKPPKRILKRIEKALLFVVDSEKEYDASRKFTNLDLIELLAKMKKLI